MSSLIGDYTHTTAELKMLSIVDHQWVDLQLIITKVSQFMDYIYIYICSFFLLLSFFLFLLLINGWMDDDYVVRFSHMYFFYLISSELIGFFNI